MQVANNKEKNIKIIIKILVLSRDEQGTSIMTVVNVIYLQCVNHLPTLNAAQLEARARAAFSMRSSLISYERSYFPNDMAKIVQNLGSLKNVVLVYVYYYLFRRGLRH